MVRYRTKLIDIVDDVKDIIICGVDQKQMQSFYLLIDGKVYYTEMNIPKSDPGYYSHKCSTEFLRDFIDNRKDGYFNIFDIEFISKIMGYSRVLLCMKEYQLKFGREYKLSQLID